MIEDSSLREKSLNCDNLTKRMRLNTNSTEDKQISNTKSEKSFSVKLPIINANLKANHYNDSNEVKARSNLERFELKVKDMKSKRYFDVYYKNSQKQDNIRNKDTSKPKQIILSKHTLRKLPLSTLVPENPTHSIILETKSFKNPRKELCKSMQILHESSTPVEIQKRRCASESLRSKSFENLKIEIERNPLNANTCKRINKFVPTPVDNKNRSNKHMLLSRENNVNVKISAKKDNTLTGSRSRSYNTYLINKNENKEIQASNLGLKYVKSNVMSTIKEIRERSPQINSSSVIIPLLKRLTKIKKLQTEYLYLIHNENNGDLVKRCMNHRVNWKECNSPSTANLRWKDTTKNLNFLIYSRQSEVKQIVNHFEFHAEITNKRKLFLNLLNYCEKNSLDVFSLVPFTIILHYDSESFVQQFEEFRGFFNNIKNYTFDVKGVKTVRNESIRKYGNVFSISLANKKLGLGTYCYVHPNQYNNRNLWLVKAIDLNRGRGILISDNPNDILSHIKTFYKGTRKEHNFKKMKSDGSTDGKDNIKENNEQAKNQEDKTASHRENIHIVPNATEELILPLIQTKKVVIKKHSRTKEAEIAEQKRKLKEKIDIQTNQIYNASIILLQKYIEKPLLFNNRKFDIRAWVLITFRYEVYIFKEGHLKAASIPFNLNDLSSFVHLTNYSVQKYSPDFSKFEEGNEISFSQFQAMLASKGIPMNLEEIISKMKKIITASLRAVRDKINPCDRRFCFEILGYDFILDEQFNVYLLEVNTNPGYEESSKLIKMLVPRMIDDCLRLTIDEVFDTEYSEEVCSKADSKSYCSPYKVEGHSDCLNMWELVDNLSCLRT